MSLLKQGSIRDLSDHKTVATWFEPEVADKILTVIKSYLLGHWGHVLGTFTRNKEVLSNWREVTFYSKQKKNDWYECHTRISYSEKLDVTALNQAKKTQKKPTEIQ